MRYVTAVIIAMFAGVIVMFLPSNVALGTATAMVMMSIYINEAAILHKVEDIEKTQKK